MNPNMFITSAKPVYVAERKTTFHVYDTRKEGAEESFVLVLVHGAGSSAMSFAAMATTLQTKIPLIAFDLRGHGKTVCDDVKDEENLHLATLIKDCESLLSVLLVSPQNKYVMVGHSLGGVVATQIAKNSPSQSVGLVVIDAVEGVALNSLEAGERAVARIPTRFKTIDDCVRWSTTEGPLRNAFYSASLSVPQQLVPLEDSTGFTWRMNLAKTVPFWKEWFMGHSEAFASIPTRRLLLLAGIENLDVPLQISQMMGKFQLKVISSVPVGHFVHEAAPGETAAIILLFVANVSKALSILQKKE